MSRIAPPEIYVSHGEDWGLGPMNVDQARELAAALLAAASEVEGWTA